MTRPSTAAIPHALPAHCLAAIAMYEKEGYELVEDFEDAEWIEDIDKGRPPSRPRKVMYRKRMSLVLS